MFSIDVTGSPAPDMTREPAWPFITAAIIHFLSLGAVPVGDLATIFSRDFKCVNVLIYSLAISLAYAYLFYKERNLFLCAIFLGLSFLVYGTIPRLVNGYNNETLATILMLLGSIFL